jgi:hypothetical protein
MEANPNSVSEGAVQGPERSKRRDIAHLVLLVVPWVLVGWLWWRVGQTTAAKQLLAAMGLVVLLAAVSVLLNFAWILHNVRIFRRKGPRTGLRASELDYRMDWTGRPVVADWPAVRMAAVVVVSPAADFKVFLSGTRLSASALPALSP